MRIGLGLNCNHADSSACIVKDGELLFAIEEERINRIKHWSGLPISSIKECLKNTNIQLEEIDYIAINSNPLSNLREKISFFLQNYLFGKKKSEILRRIKKKVNIKKDINKFFFPTKLSKNLKVYYIDHHKSHIASAFYASNFKKAIGLSIDGFGDFCSLSIAQCDKNKIDVIEKVFFPDSLGLFYEAFTQLIGFKNYGDEYKVMGLSSYGKPRYFDILQKEIFNDRDDFKINLKYFNHTNKNFSYNFLGKPIQNKILNNKIKNLINLGQVNKKNVFENINLQRDIACSVQKIFEDKIIKIINNLKIINFSKNLVYAGGCALNSLANKKIYESKLFENIFIPYAPGDGGGSIGAVLEATKKIDKNVKFTNLRSPFIGPKYDNHIVENEIKKIDKLKKFKIIYNLNNKDLNEKIANYIYRNKVIGFFSDRMEFGARALGNRSILANPCNKNMKNIINKKIKRRETFRPFAPSILFEKKKEWFNNTFNNPYMSSVENINKDKRKYIPAVTHVDGTGRVQTVSKDINPNFHNLIKAFYKISKVPILLNTSFNENEPIVMKPSHAINCFLRTKMDVLVINNILIIR